MVHVGEDTIVLDRPSMTPGQSSMCRFNRDAEACWAKQLIEGYLAAVKTGA